MYQLDLLYLLFWLTGASLYLGGGLALLLWVLWQIIEFVCRRLGYPISNEAPDIVDSRVAANRLSTSRAAKTRQAGTGSANPFSSYAPISSRSK
jgi:hypothetical protein